MDRPAPSGLARPARWRRLLLFLLPAAAFFFLVAAATVERGEVPTPGKPAPVFEAPLLASGETFSLAELRGQPVFLNFWWSGCKPCQQEAPLLSKAHRLYGEKVAFVGVNIKDARSEALQFVERHDLDYTHVRDQAFDLYRRYGLTGQPESFFIDRDGVVVEHVLGPVDEQSLVTLLGVLVRRDA